MFFMVYGKIVGFNIIRKKSVNLDSSAYVEFLI